MEKETQTQETKLKREVWDCESSLYDSFELKTFERQLDSAISARTMSMPHLRHDPPPPSNHKTTTKKQSNKLTRSLNKFLRSVFRLKHNNSSSYGVFYAYDTSSTLSTIPEIPEFDRLSPDMNSLMTRSRSDRFVPASIGVSCA